jgi:regulator of protease activity HflC (stomatin/prohibitin superfamily)
MKQSSIIGLVAGGLSALFLVIIFLMSFTDVDMGSEGFVYRPYGDGIDTTMYYGEGTYLIAPWNSMVTYNVRKETRTYESKVMDINGTEVSLVVSVNFSATTGKIANLHKLHGPGYVESLVDAKVKGAIKDVVGRYTYEEVYSSKREVLEKEIEHILEEDFTSNYVNLGFVEIADVDLPTPIANEITNKETQKQRNLKSELMKVEEKNLADALIEKSRGDSSLVVSASYKAAAIKKEAEELKANPAYIEYIKWRDASPDVPRVPQVVGSSVIMKDFK